jgi:hypothetical protein
MTAHGTRSVLQILVWLALSIQQLLDAFDDLLAVGQEQLQQFDMRLERHLANTFACHTAPPP